MLDRHLRFIFGLAPDGLRKSPMVLDSLENPVIHLCRPRRRGRANAFMFEVFPIAVAAAFSTAAVSTAWGLPTGTFSAEGLSVILGAFVAFALVSSYPVAYFAVRWFAVWRPGRDWMDELASTPLRRGEVALAHYVWGLTAAVRAMFAVTVAFLAGFLLIAGITFASVQGRLSTLDIAGLAIVVAAAGPMLLYVAAIVPLALDQALGDMAKQGDSKWGWLNLFFIGWALYLARSTGWLLAILVLVFLTASLFEFFAALLGEFLVMGALAASGFACWLAVGPVIEVVAMRLADGRHREMTAFFWELNEESW